MSGRGGIYEGPDGTKLYGDGREVNPVDTSKWRDKPAATGSGEPMNPADCTCEYVHCSSLSCRSKEPSRGAVPEEARHFPASLAPTPPASQPTVTFGRDDYDKLCEGLSGLARFADYDSDRMTAEELLALLRAAEQK